MAVSLPGQGDPNPVRQNTAIRQLSEELDKANTELTEALAAETQAREDADALKAPIADPVFTGDPQAPTPVEDDDSASIATTAYVQTEIAGFAPIANPVFTGDPQAPTPAADDNTTSIATTEYVQTELGDYAPLADPVFTGVPEAPTATEGTDTTQIATTEFVQTAVKWELVKKTADQAITSSTTLVDDDELYFSVDANVTYVIKLVMFIVAGAAVAGAKIGINGPASPTSINATRLVNTQISSVWYLMQQYASVTDYSVPLFNIDNPQVIAPMRFDILFKNGANAGTFAVQIAQSSSSGTATTFQAGSYLEYAVI